MGTPANYSQELPARCLRLIDALWPAVEDVRIPGQEQLGPLTTTFLLAMATPIITFPIERIERYRGKAEAGYMNERPLDEAMATEVDRVLIKGTLGKAPFFREGDWRFAVIQNDNYNLARRYPDELHDALSAADALDAASKMPSQEWTSCLRNALAHGGVLYLDGQGRPSHDQQAEMLAFVSAKYQPDDLRRSRSPERLKVLRIEEKAFRSFLHAWADWVRGSGLGASLAP